MTMYPSPPYSSLDIRRLINAILIVFAAIAISQWQHSSASATHLPTHSFHAYPRQQKNLPSLGPLSSSRRKFYSEYTDCENGLLDDLSEVGYAPDIRTISSSTRNARKGITNLSLDKGSHTASGRRETGKSRSSSMPSSPSSPAMGAKSMSLQELLSSFTAEGVIDALKRLPAASISTTKAVCNSYLQTAIYMIPMGLVFNLGSMKQGAKVWMNNGLKMGNEWSRVSALFAGGDVFFAKLRGVNDKWNSYLGSGVTSALLQCNEGPLKAAQAFLMGFGFFYAIDLLQSRQEQTPENKPKLQRSSK